MVVSVIFIAIVLTIKLAIKWVLPGGVQEGLDPGCRLTVKVGEAPALLLCALPLLRTLLLWILTCYGYLLLPFCGYCDMLLGSLIRHNINVVVRSVFFGSPLV